MKLLSSGGAIILLFLILLAGSCKKEQLLTSGGELRFSTDTLTFDTVFTQFASFTMGVKIFNPQGQKINISSVRLEKGNASFFTLNVNGIPGNNVKDLELAANDSLYVFATVRIDPNDETNPFIIEDRIIATLNNQDFSIPVIAYGQNAHYIIDSVIAQSDTWENDLPYVIMKNALVAEGVTLTINKGCRIYMHADSRLFVEGTLITNGTKEDSVIFQGDRLDRAYFGYEGYPGEWGGIYFTSNSSGNELNWTILKNCGNSTRLGTAVFFPAAIQVNSDSSNGTIPQLVLNNTIIQNSIGYGILSFGASVSATNLLIHDCGAQALALFQGGRYRFDNCDFINYQPRKLSHIDNPTVAVLNYFDVTDTEFWEGSLDAVFRNCVIYGSIEDELLCRKKGSAAYNARFDHCYIKSSPLPTSSFTLPDYLQLEDCIFNDDPQLENPDKWDFRPKSGSPLIDKGIAIPGLDIDLNGRLRTGPPDLGCYEAD